MGPGDKDKLTVPAGFLGNGLSQLGYTPLVFATLPKSVPWMGWEYFVVGFEHHFRITTLCVDNYTTELCLVFTSLRFPF